jgi:HK97 gp10 family phage protein
MANQPAVRIEGLREVRKQLKDFNDKVGKDMLRDAHKQLADRVVKLAEPRVPVRTGALVASVRGLGSVSAATGKAGGAKGPYAAAVHWGTGPRPGLRGPHNIPRRPFLLDALNQLEPDAADEYAEQLRRLISRLKGLG